jgi:hypothetical protein
MNNMEHEAEQLTCNGQGFMASASCLWFATKPLKSYLEKASVSRAQETERENDFTHNT